MSETTTRSELFEALPTARSNRTCFAPSVCLAFARCFCLYVCQRERIKVRDFFFEDRFIPKMVFHLSTPHLTPLFITLSLPSLALRVRLSHRERGELFQN